MSEAVFIALDEQRFRATELSRGPWDPGAQHGGAPAALLMREFERLAGDQDNLRVARVTYEFLRPVPLEELEAGAELVRPGKRVQLLEGWLRDTAGTELVRARALRVAATAVNDAGEEDPPPTPPQEGRANDYPSGGVTMFSTDAMEIRFTEGAFLTPGPAAAWFRLRHELVAGESPTPLQLLAAAGDFSNGISATVSWDAHVFINPDLTLYIERAPQGEWVALRSHTRIRSGGIGVSESVLFDERGRVGRAIQALLVTER